MTLPWRNQHPKQKNKWDRVGPQEHHKVKELIRNQNKHFSRKIYTHVVEDQKKSLVMDFHPLAKKNRQKR